MEENNELYLVYVERLNNIPNAKGLYEYEFYFSENPDIVWGQDWNEQCPSACSPENLRPDMSMYSKIHKLYSIYQLKGIQENSCFSMQDMIDGITCLCYEDISELEEYPEPFRLVFQFGETFEEVEDKLAQRHQFFANNNITKKEDMENGDGETTSM